MHHLFKGLAFVAAITMAAGCGKFSGKRAGQNASAEADAQRMLTEFNKTDINSYPAATAATTKEEADKSIKELSRYKKVGTDVLKIAEVKKLNLEHGDKVSQNLQTADALIQSYKTQTQKLDLEYQK